MEKEKGLDIVKMKMVHWSPFAAANNVFVSISVEEAAAVWGGWKPFHCNERGSRRPSSSSSTEQQ